MLNASLLAVELIRDERLRLHPYVDTVGKLTIGVGRNLTDVGITQEEAQHLLHNDIARVTMECARTFDFWASLDDTRQRVVANMVFNLGLDGVLEFRRMLAAIRARDYPAAADEMLDSAWATQVGARAQRLAVMMRTGAIV